MASAERRGVIGGGGANSPRKDLCSAVVLRLHPVHREALETRFDPIWSLLTPGEEAARAQSWGPTLEADAAVQKQWPQGTSHGGETGGIVCADPPAGQVAGTCHYEKGPRRGRTGVTSEFRVGCRVLTRDLHLNKLMQTSRSLFKSRSGV